VCCVSAAKGEIVLSSHALKVHFQLTIALYVLYVLYVLTDIRTVFPDDIP
jgi:hypothetical protein